MKQSNAREQTIIRTSLIGIAVNLGLSTAKVAAGLTAHSLALVLDAVNNLSGQDALLDAIIALSTLTAAGLYLATGISIEPFLGVVIALVILKAGLEILKEGSSAILGQRIESRFSREIKRTIVSVNSEIHGAFDLLLNNYGPNRFLGMEHNNIIGMHGFYLNEEAKKNLI